MIGKQVRYLLGEDEEENREGGEEMVMVISFGTIIAYQWQTFKPCFPGVKYYMAMLLKSPIPLSTNNSNTTIKMYLFQHVFDPLLLFLIGVQDLKERSTYVCVYVGVCE